MADTLLTTPAPVLASESAQSPFDCVIVGGGSSGLTVARTVAERGPSLRLALLEGGPAPFLTHVTNTELRFSRELTRSVRDQVSYWPTLPDGSQFGPNYGCLGGRGLFWNGAAPRFRDHDFDGWPLSPVDLHAHYQWAEREFRVTRRLGESDVARRIIDCLSASGFPAEPGPFAVDCGVAAPGTLGAGIASGLGMFFRGAGEAVAVGRVRVATDTLVHRIIHEGGSASGVVASTGGGDAVEIAARSVVLAAGGIESSRIAVLSAVPDSSGTIGVGLQEHHFFDCWFEAPHLYSDAEPAVAVVWVPSAAQDAAQWELHAPGRSLFTLDDGLPWQPAAAERYRVMIRSFCATDKAAANRVEPRPGPRGSATIHFVHTPVDEQRRSRMLTDARRLADQLGMEAVGELEVDAPARFRAPGSSYHDAGGLDMGTDPATSVTDTDGRFHAVGNLVCADAAAFPRIGATNPHLTIVALARRKALALADRLR